MDSKDRRTNLYLLLIMPFALTAAIWSIATFPLARVDKPLIALSVIAVFFSGYFRIQIPKTKIHLTISDALIFLSFLMYGGQVAVLISLFEATYASLTMRFSGVNMRPRTMLINISIAVTSVFAMVLMVGAFYGAPDPVKESTAAGLVSLLALMAFSQFLVNSICVSAFIAIKTESSPWKVWNEYCVNVLVLYMSGSIVAGVLRTAIEQINFFLIASVIGFFALVYFTYRRYTNDVKETFALAEQAERRRAEQAEKHVIELEHYVDELEKSSEALRESREKFRHAAFHDNLTGLPNRNRFLELIGGLLTSETDSEKKFAVLFLDLNRFKTLNDSLGHSVGDRLIVSVAKRLRTVIREGDVVGRFSGDEFSIILKNISSRGDATEFATRLSKKMAEPFSLDGRQVFTSVAIGISFFDPKYENAEEILRDADIAMYYAKDRQKDFEIFDRKMHAKAVSLLDLETDLRFAILRNEFELFYQPIVDLETARIQGFEALVRWNHPKWGLVRPDEFIPVAETTGLIIPMTVQVLRSACQQIVQWQALYLGLDDLMVSVNLSGKHFAVPGLVEQISGILQETNLQPRNLRLEITESAVMENAENSIAMLQKIKDLGIRISIDDFGTGYSSLSYLHRFPVDTLKVDRSFVGTMEAGTENGEIVRTIIALARALKLSVVAEGIESIHQFHQLRTLRCEYGQGYLFSRPLPVKEAEKLLTDATVWHNIIPQDKYNPDVAERPQERLELTH